MSGSKVKTLEIKLDKNIKTRDDLFVKLLKGNTEFVDFMKNYKDKSLVDVLEQLKIIKSAKKRSKTASIKKQPPKKSHSKTRNAGLKGGMGREQLLHYIRMALYFIYCAVIAFGFYHGSDMIMVGINQVRSGTCYSWTNRLTSAFGTRHPFCDVWWNITDTLVRALSGFEPNALATVAISGSTPVVALYIQMRAINGLAGAITDRIVGAQEGHINYPSGPILIRDTQVINLPAPTPEILPTRVASPSPARQQFFDPISSDEGSPSPTHDARTHPSRRANIGRRSRHRSRSRSSPSGGSKTRRH